MRTLLISIVLLALPHAARAQCFDEYFGTAGDTLYYGSERWGSGPTEYAVQYTRVITKDSTAPDGGRYWWTLRGGPDPVIMQHPSGAVSLIFTGVVQEPKYGMCDIPDRVYRSSGMVYLGLDVILLFGKPTLAQRYAKYRFYGDSAEYAELDYFVVPQFGEVLEYETHHGIEQIRLVGAVVNGVRYGYAATITSVAEEPTALPLRIEGDVLRASGAITSGSEVQVYDLRGQLVLRMPIEPHGSVSVASLSGGLYMALVVDPRSGARTMPVRVVVR
jgi:hypothetical protein